MYRKFVIIIFGKPNTADYEGHSTGFAVYIASLDVFNS